VSHVAQEPVRSIIHPTVPAQPDNAGDPIGCVATTFTFSPAFFEEECLSRFLRLETDPAEDGPAYLVEREEKLAQLTCAVRSAIRRLAGEIMDAVRQDAANVAAEMRRYIDIVAGTVSG
jgi:hypothetical protein